MPASGALFHKAVVQSGSGEGVADVDAAAGIAHELLAELGIAPDVASNILTVPTAELLRAQEAVLRAARVRGAGTALAFAPIVDGRTLTEPPIDAIRRGVGSHIPLLLGANGDEGRMFTVLDPGAAAVVEAAVGPMFAATYPEPEVALAVFRTVERDTSPAGLIAALIGERMFGGPTRRLAEARAESGGDVWRYLFCWSSTALDGRIGACHSLELPFVFDNLAIEGVERFTGARPSQDLADALGRAWAAFARDGDPGDWPRYESVHRDVRPDPGPSRVFVRAGVTARTRARFELRSDPGRGGCNARAGTGRAGTGLSGVLRKAYGPGGRRIGSCARAVVRRIVADAPTTPWSVPGPPGDLTPKSPGGPRRQLGCSRVPSIE